MKLSDKIFGRLCSGLLARFRKMSGRLCAQDLSAMKISFSQHGEDLLIAEHLFGASSSGRGIYIDAGCFDPFLHSNTRLLHLFGWRGINIDAAADVIEKFNRYRPFDTNICAALSDRVEEAILVGAPGQASRGLAGSGTSGTAQGRLMTTTTLATVLERAVNGGAVVDLLDVDCEDRDLAVMCGFPFERFRPRLIAVEAHDKQGLRDLAEFLGSKAYVHVGTRGPTHLFRDRETIPASLSPSTRITEIHPASD